VANVLILAGLDPRLLECDVLLSSWFPAFRMFIEPPSSGWSSHGITILWNVRNDLPNESVTSHENRIIKITAGRASGQSHIRIVGKVAEIQTGYLLNANQEHYRSADVLRRFWISKGM